MVLQLAASRAQPVQISVAAVHVVAFLWGRACASARPLIRKNKLSDRICQKSAEKRARGYGEDSRRVGAGADGAVSANGHHAAFRESNDVQPGEHIFRHLV
jgi:hypothetical protein